MTKTKEKPKKTTTTTMAMEQMSAFIKAKRAKAKQDIIMKAAKDYLETYAGENTEKFDDRGNLQLNGGYIHLASKTEIVNCDTFDFNKFIKAYPELVDFKMKTAAIKAMLQSEAGIKKLTTEHCVTLETKESLEIIVDR